MTQATSKNKLAILKSMDVWFKIGEYINTPHLFTAYLRLKLFSADAMLFYHRCKLPATNERTSRNTGRFCLRESWLFAMRTHTHFNYLIHSVTIAFFSIFLDWFLNTRDIAFTSLFSNYSSCCERSHSSMKAWLWFIDLGKVLEYQRQK